MSVNGNILNINIELKIYKINRTQVKIIKKEFRLQYKNNNQLNLAKTPL